MVFSNPFANIRTGRARAAEKGQAGYDNPRENIDPHVKTKVIDTKEIISQSIGNGNDLIIKGDLVPDLGNTYDIGHYNKAWRFAWISGGLIIGTTGNSIVANGNIYTLGKISGAYIYGDGSNLTNLPFPDNDGKYLLLSGANANQAININSQNFLTSGNLISSGIAYLSGASVSGDISAENINIPIAGNRLSFGDDQFFYFNSIDLIINNKNNVVLSGSGLSVDKTISGLNLITGTISGSKIYCSGLISGAGLNATGISGAEISWVKSTTPIIKPSAALTSCALTIQTKATFGGTLYNYVFGNDGSLSVNCASARAAMEISGGGIVINNQIDNLSLSNGGIIYVSGGALYYKGGSGTLTRIAIA